MRSRVSREIQYLRLLSHPHIIKLWVHLGANIEFSFLLDFPSYEVIDTPVSVVMVMEVRSPCLPLYCDVNKPLQFTQYAEGELFYLISHHGRVSEAEARSYFQQIMYVWLVESP